MANVPLVANPIFPPVPDEPKLDIEPTDEQGQKVQQTFDQLWKWMKDVSVQLKILFGSPQASNSAITIPLVQPGMILAFGGIPGNIPTGYALCDGSQLSQTQFAALFSAIGTTWNTGGESPGNFRVPDLRGRDLIGAGTGSGLTPRSSGQTGGEETHVLVTSEIPSHPHGVTDPGHPHGVTDPTHFHNNHSYTNLAGGAFTWVTGTSAGPAPVDHPPSGDGRGITDSQPTGVTVNPATTGISVNNTGGGGAHNNMQPFGVIQWIIKY